MKTFNTSAVCIPSINYMVDISERVREIAKLVDNKEYFVINRARQYGKTTTLVMLSQYLSDRYEVVFLSFEGMGSYGFKSETAFVKTFCRRIHREAKRNLTIPPEIMEQITDFISRTTNEAGFEELNDMFIDWCDISDKPVVLMIDEVDSATNNEVFISFLGMLRDNYIKRQYSGAGTFHSVILAGVTDIRHLKSKIRNDGQHSENSPWNIAADFKIDMSLSESGIKGMLDEYEADHHTGMDTSFIAKQIRDYTSGYPFLVSRICQLLDTDVTERLGLSTAWTRTGMDEAIKQLLVEKNTLFQSLNSKLANYPEMKATLRGILMEGRKRAYNPFQTDIELMEMYGFIKNENGSVKISNRIFETLLYNLFLSDDEAKSSSFFQEGDFTKNIFVEDGRLNVKLILERFIVTYTQICGPLEEQFKEKDGRELFLLYLKPIINGTGNYYIEAQTRDQHRTDVIIDYLGQQYIIELKIWRGERYNADGERQICEYLDYFGLDTGYMLSFNFNKKKEQGVKRIQFGEKILYEGTV